MPITFNQSFSHKKSVYVLANPVDWSQLGTVVEDLLGGWNSPVAKTLQQQCKNQALAEIHLYIPVDHEFDVHKGYITATINLANKNNAITLNASNATFPHSSNIWNPLKFKDYKKSIKSPMPQELITAEQAYKERVAPIDTSFPVSQHMISRRAAYGLVTQPQELYELNAKLKNGWNSIAANILKDTYTEEKLSALIFYVALKGNGYASVEINPSRTNTLTLYKQTSINLEDQKDDFFPDYNFSESFPSKTAEQAYDEVTRYFTPVKKRSTTNWDGNSGSPISNNNNNNNKSTAETPPSAKKQRKD